MKKLVYAVITTVIVATTMVNVSADSQSPFPKPIYDDERVVNTEDPTTEIPVFGYIGQDANITDPEDEDGGLVINPVTTDMTLSVPIRVVWAAFASDGGEITSPVYTITNNSPFAVKVALEEFENTTKNKKEDMDDKIVISLIDKESKPLATNVVGMTGPIDLAAISANGGLTTFKIGGTYTGNFGDEYLPTYNMLLTFSIH